MYRDIKSVADDAAFLNTLANGLRVVEVLAEGPITLRELAAKTELPRQSAYRIVHTLDVMGWVSRIDDSYRLTTALWGIGVRSHGATDLRAEWSATVERLGTTTGETVHLAVYDQGYSVYIAKHDGWHPIRSYTKLGGRSPAYCVATGKALLAFQPQDEFDRLVEGGLTQFTDTTLTERAELSAALRDVRESGYAVNHGEYRAEVGGIAVPIRSPLGEVIAAIGFSGPVARIEGNLDDLLRELRGVVTES